MPRLVCRLAACGAGPSGLATPAEADAIAVEMPRWAWGLTLLVDLLMWVALYWRDYTIGTNVAIAHYYSFMTITDLPALRVSWQLKAWWQPFRAAAALSFLFLDVSLLLNGLETPGLVFLRLGACLLRLLHALWCLWAFGPKRQWQALPRFGAWYLQHVSGAPLLLALWACLGFFCPYVFILMHYNYGDLRLDAPLTALQGTYILTVVAKSAVLDMTFMSRSQAERWNLEKAGVNELIACILFSGQYPLIFDTYWLPPLRMGHLLAEILFAIIAFAYLFLDFRVVFEDTTKTAVCDA